MLFDAVLIRAAETVGRALPLPVVVVPEPPEPEAGFAGGFVDGVEDISWG